MTDSTDESQLGSEKTARDHTTCTYIATLKSAPVDENAKENFEVPLIEAALFWNPRCRLNIAVVRMK